MAELPQLGRNNPVEGNSVDGNNVLPPDHQRRRGLVGYYVDKNISDMDFPIIRINGHNGAVDIGGTDNRQGLLILRDRNVAVTFTVDGQSGESRQLGDIILADLVGGVAQERMRLSGQNSDVIIRNQEGQQVIHLDGQAAEIEVGGDTQAGTLVIRGPAGQEMFRLEGQTGRTDIGGTILLEGQSGDVILGGNGQDGDLKLQDSDAIDQIHVDGGNAAANLGGTVRLLGKSGRIHLGGDEQSGTLTLQNSMDEESIRLDGQDGKANIGKAVVLEGQSGDVILGGNGQDGDLKLMDASAAEQIHVDGGNAAANLGGTVRLLGGSGHIHLGGEEQSGTLTLQNPSDVERIRLEGETATAKLGASLILDGSSGKAVLGGDDQDGVVELRNQNDSATVRLDADSGSLRLGPNLDDQDTIRFVGTTGDGVITGKLEIGVETADGTKLQVNGLTETKDLDVRGQSTVENLSVNRTATIKQLLTVSDKIETKALNATGETTLDRLTVNGLTRTENIIVRNSDHENTITIDGNVGDIRLENADCAEDFDVVETEEISPGTVMVLTNQGKIRASSEPYDKKVAGIISGAGNYNPGIVLDQQQNSSHKRLPLALIGKVFCQVDADFAPIEVGDLLTTSSTRGHAMKAGDPLAAFGAVIGKALSPLEHGKGLIPVLVALQ